MPSRTFYNLTLKDILLILCSAAIPVALTIYSSTIHKQEQEELEQTHLFEVKQAEEARQQNLYDGFLDNIFKLDKHGYLAENQTPWAFANAYYRSAHRDWDPIRKADVLIFLKEHELVGRSDCSPGCKRKPLPGIIRLDRLSFERVHFQGETGVLNPLKLDCMLFDQVSLSNAKFSFVNLNGAAFIGGRLNNAQFEGSSLNCTSFVGVDLQGVDFGDADLTDTLFSNVDLSGAKLTEKQLEQAIFHNSTLPKGVSNQTRIRIAPRKVHYLITISIGDGGASPIAVR